MRRKGILIVALCVIALFLVMFPTIEIKTDDKFIACRYSDDISEFEDEISFGESYWYYKKLDISFYSYDVKKFLCFYVITMEYIEGNYCDTEFVLEEKYIGDFLERAEIQWNESNIDLAKLIEGKEAVVDNKRYVYSDLEEVAYIDYVLDGEYETMIIFYVDDLLIIEVGLPDEGARYIAYR